MAKKKKSKVMIPVLSMGSHKCPECYNDITLPIKCPICDHQLRGFLFEVGDFAEIITHLNQNQLNRCSFYYFGEVMMYDLIEGVKQKVQLKPGKKKPPKKKPTKKLKTI